MKHAELSHSRIRGAGPMMVSAVLLSLAAAPCHSNPSPDQVAPGTSVATPGEARELVKQGDAALQNADSLASLQSSTEYFRRAAELGDPGAMRRYGEALVLGRGVEANPVKGRELIQSAAGLNDSSAILLLADDAAKGLNGGDRRVEAIVLYEKAAALGRQVALIKLAQIYQAGEIVPPDLAKAVSYYRQAIAAGRSDAMTALGAGLVERRLGGIASRAEGIALLNQAMALGHPDAVVVLSDFQLLGMGTQRNPAKALTMLRDAWEQGNVKAGLKLLAIYRDGRKGAVKPDRFLAEYYFRKVSGKLSPNDRLIQEILMRVSKARSRIDFQKIQASMNDVAATSRPLIVRKIRGINANAYVYLVQKRLRELDLLKDEATGILSLGTIRAIRKYCDSTASSLKCSKGPLTAGAAEAIAAAF